MTIWQDTPELRYLREIIKDEFTKTGKVTVECPYCHQKPELIENTEYGYKFSCLCEMLEAGEKY